MKFISANRRLYFSSGALYLVAPWLKNQQLTWLTLKSSNLATCSLVNSHLSLNSLGSTGVLLIFFRHLQCLGVAPAVSSMTRKSNYVFRAYHSHQSIFLSGIYSFIFSSFHKSNVDTIKNGALTRPRYPYKTFSSS